MTEELIEFPDLDEFLAQDTSPEPVTVPVGVGPVTSPFTDDKGPEPATAPVRRKRRTKAEIEAAKAAGTFTSHRSNGTSPEFLSDGSTPSPYTPEHSEAAAAVLGYQSAEQRDRILSAERITRETVTAALAAEDVPDVTETMVLVDEIHFLRSDLQGARDDVRELAAEVRKLTLAFERSPKG